jgi:hypothetical protein
MIHDDFSQCNLGRIFKDFWNGCQGFSVLIYRNIAAGTHGERLLWQGYCFTIGLTTGTPDFYGHGFICRTEKAVPMAKTALF